MFFYFKINIFNFVADVLFFSYNIIPYNKGIQDIRRPSRQSLEGLRIFSGVI